MEAMNITNNLEEIDILEIISQFDNDTDTLLDPNPQMNVSQLYHAEDILNYFNLGNRPSMYVCEEPEDKVRFRYRTEIEKKACTKLKGRSQNSYPKIMIANCPFPIRVCASLSNGTETKNKLSLYDARTKDGSNKGNPNLTFSEGDCCCKSSPDVNCDHYVEFNGIGVEIIKLADAKQSLRENKKIKLAHEKNPQVNYISVPDDNFSAQELKNIDKEVSAECKDYLNCRLKLKYSAAILCPDGQEITNLINDCFSMEFTNAKSAAWATPEVITYAPATCSSSNETVVIIVLKSGVNKSELIVYIRDAANPDIIDKARVIELHHKVTLECGIPPQQNGMSENIEFAVVNKQNEYDDFEWKKLTYVWDEFDLRKRRKSSPRFEPMSTDSPPSSVEESQQSMDTKGYLRQRLLAKKHPHLAGRHNVMINGNDLAGRHNVMINGNDIVADACELVAAPRVPTADPTEDDVTFDCCDSSCSRKMSQLSINGSKEEHPDRRDIDRGDVLGYIVQTIARKSSPETAIKSVIEMNHHISALSKRDHYGDNPLHNALLQGNFSSAQFLLNIAISHAPQALTQPNSSLQTPLHILVGSTYSNLNEEEEKVVVKIAESFVSACPEIVTLRDNMQRNVIHYAVIRGKEKLCQTFINALTFVNEDSLIDNLDAEQFAPLHYAIIGDHINLVKALISAGANVNTTAGRNLRTPLHLAALYRREEIGLLLLQDKNVDINASQENGISVLSLAEENECGRLVSELESKCAFRGQRYSEDIDDLPDTICHQESSDIDCDAKLFIAQPATESASANENSSTEVAMPPIPKQSESVAAKLNLTTVSRGEIIEVLKAKLNEEEFFHFARSFCVPSSQEGNDEIIGCLKCVSVDCRWDALEDIAADRLTSQYLNKFLPNFLSNELKRMDIYNQLFSES